MGIGKTVSLLILIMLLHVMHCANMMAGGGSGAGNSVVVGKIYTETGSPSPNAVVKVIPEKYNPVADGTVPDSLIDTTDDNGCYSLTVSDSGIFNIEAVHSTLRTRLLVTGITVQEDTTEVPSVILKKPGVIRLFLPDTVDTANGYVYIAGTTVYRNLSDALPEIQGLSIIIDSVPASLIPGFRYDKLNSPVEPVQITDTISVISGDTSETEAFLFWAHYMTGNSGLTGNRIYKMLIASDGTMWITVFYNGIAHFTGNTWEIFDSTNSVVPAVCMDIAQDKNDILYFSTMKKGYVTYDGADWKVCDTTVTGLPSNYVVSLVIDSTGNLWIGMYDGIASYDISQDRYTVHDMATTGLPTHRIQDISVDADNNVWFAIEQGAGRFDNNSIWTHYANMPDTVSYFVETDGDNNKWFGHQYGVSRFDGSLWLLYDETTSTIFSGQVRSVFTDNDNGVWVGTDIGLTRFDGAQWNDYSGKRYSMLDNKRIESITKDADGNVWVGTYEDGFVGFGPTIK